MVDGLDRAGGDEKPDDEGGHEEGEGYGEDGEGSDDLRRSDDGDGNVGRRI